MKLINKISLNVILALTLFMAGCDKTKPYNIDVAQPVAHFDGAETQSYAVRTANVDPYVIEVGTSDVATVDRVVTFNISSPTGATAGTQYTISGNTITIPAGKATANISIQGLYAGFPALRVDTLIITLAEPSIKPAQFSDTLRLAIGDICSEGVNFDITTFLGNYPNTIENTGGAPYGPYTTSILSATSTGPTSGTIVVANIWDNGWDPLTFNLDWSDPTHLTAIVVANPAIGGSDAGDLNPAYAGQTIAIRDHPTAGPGTFSSCNNTLTFKMQLGVTALGYFANVYTVNMAR